MSKYLFIGSYTQAGVAGVIKEGGSSRRAVVDQLVRGLGGKLESLHFALGEDDFFIIAELPGNVEAAATSLMVHATGAAKGRFVVLLTPEEVDEATKKTVTYRPPGQ